MESKSSEDEDNNMKSSLKEQELDEMDNTNNSTNDEDTLTTDAKTATTTAAVTPTTIAATETIQVPTGDEEVGDAAVVPKTKLRRDMNIGAAAVSTSRPGALAVYPSLGNNSSQPNAGRHNQDESLDVITITPNAARSRVGASSTSGDTPAHNMLQARPVPHEDHVNVNALPQANPVVHVHGNSNLSPQQQYQKRQLRMLAIVAAIITVPMIVVLAVIFGRSDEETATQPTMFSYAMALNLPRGTIDAIFSSPNATIDADFVTASNSNHTVWKTPQAMAYSWLLNDPLLDSYPTWKQRQRFALATLYYSTTGEQWTQPNSFLSYEIDECFWKVPPNIPEEEFEPSCDENGEFAFLYLDRMGLRGPLPMEFVLLTNLEEANFFVNNDMGGSIPTEIGIMKKMRRLRLQRTSLVGTIPTEIGKLEKLEELRTELTFLSGTIPTELAGIQSLSHFSLLYQPLMKGNIPTELFLLTNITNFQIQSCENLRLESLQWIHQLTNAIGIFINDIPLRDTIPTEIGLLTKLTRLEFYNAEMRGTIPSEVFGLTQLTRLQVDDNLMTGSFPLEQLESLTNLESLWINGNAFTGAIPSSERIWAALPNLTEFKLNNNLWSSTIPTGMTRLFLGVVLSCIVLSP